MNPCIDLPLRAYSFEYEFDYLLDYLSDYLFDYLFMIPFFPLFIHLFVKLLAMRVRLIQGPSGRAMRPSPACSPCCPAVDCWMLWSWRRAQVASSLSYIVE